MLHAKRIFFLQDILQIKQMLLQFVNSVYISICLLSRPTKVIFHVLKNSPAWNFHILSHPFIVGNFLSIEKCDGIGNNTIRLKYINERLQLLLHACAMLKRLERLKKRKRKKRKDIEGHRRKDGHGVERKEAM